MRDLTKDLFRSMSTYGVDKIQGILTSLHSVAMPIVQNIAIRRWIVFSPLIDVANQTIDITQGADLQDSESDGGFMTLSYVRFIPPNVYVYQLTQTQSGTISFPNGHQKFGGDGQFDGAAYIQWVDHADVNMGTGKTSFAVWFWGTASGTYGIFCKRNINNTTNAGIEIWISGTTLNIRISDGTNTVLLSETFANLYDGNKHSLVFNIPDTGNLEIIVDGVSLGTISRGSVGSVTNTRTAYFGVRDNNGALQDYLVGHVSWFSWKRGEIYSSGQITDYMAGILRYAAGSNVEVTTIPFIATADPLPNAFAGLFMAHT